eukprot:TRINITY_DN11658_c0_g1_i1.p2 TRINITY_DN11658_c0_g1~~TRINITY_DN11658_c0_g1_i1.p2  ORF type:complete len:548 (+),score=159.60 TRINITY_DN11658_c0_g1_i1:92-1645(+)
MALGGDELTQRRQHAKELGLQFIKEYYTRLKRDALELRQMYHTSLSVFCHCRDGEQSQVVSGPSDIEAQLQRAAADCTGSKIHIETVECMPSHPQPQDGHSGGVLVTVSGRVLFANSQRHFRQCFLLVPIAESYYIHNDWMHLGASEDHAVGGRSAPPQQQPPPVHVDPAPALPPPEPVHEDSPELPAAEELEAEPVPAGEEDPVEEPEEDAYPEQEQAPLEEELPAAGLRHDELCNGAPLEEESPAEPEQQEPAPLDESSPKAAEAPAKLTSYAAIVQASKPGARPATKAPVRVTAPSPAGAPPGATTERAPRAARGEDSTWGNSGWGTWDKSKAAGGDRPPRTAGKKGEPRAGKGAREGGRGAGKGAEAANGEPSARPDVPAKFQHHSIYVSDLPHTIRESDIDKIFGKFGEIKGKTLRPPICFVDYDDREAMASAIAAAGGRDGLCWESQRISVAERKSPEQRHCERVRGGDDQFTKGGKGGRGGRGGKGQAPRGRGGRGGGGRAPAEQAVGQP